MKYLIEYHSVQSDHIFASPTYWSSEAVVTDSVEKLTEYISTKTDMWGHPYRLNEDFQNPNSVSRKYQYISNQGGVIVSPYEEMVFTSI
jgi:hypothetical protein